MSNGWDFDAKSNNTTFVKTEYTKFPVGITRIRIIDDAPHMRWAHWWNPSKRYITCPGKTCPICEIRRRQKANGEIPTHNMTRRYSVNIINRETSKNELLEQGVGFFEDVRDLKEDLEKKNKSLKDADIKVKRRGTDKDDTSYRLDLDEIEALPSNLEKLLEKKYDLEAFYVPHDTESIIRLINGEKWEDVMYKNNNIENNTTSEDDEEVEIK